MARYTGPRVRVSRRLGFNVFENRKGDKALQDRPYPPGENGKKRMRETDYGTQLKEKQKVRYMYGVLEKQFRNYYKEATRMPGITGENLLVLLESRIDNVIYRAGFAATRPQARQLVSHRHFKLNGKLISILDADDYFEPEKIKKQVDIFNNYPDVSICATWANFYNELNKIIYSFKTRNKEEELKKKKINLMTQILQLLIFQIQEQ